ncbi:MAG: sodium/solute symporter [Bacteroidales bacterium]|jgi:SSS family solute:Na+ symporter|nr:sodium/solute symporter [Bacteroidales bacterium]MDD3737495.1 sodium:solute symporter [Bacteroidales bacterium]HOO65495.1 sodium:solute symporter [Bacteroidales bacterium]HPJ03923.1 sodium:solute symporter [Bacteroidales bacterium]HPQ62618.1 sodium:solute symporter [Bacteroidales bacterium]
MLTLDWIVLGAFVLALVIFIVLSIRTKDKTSTDYFLAGRDATWIAIGASIFASNIGSEHLVGLAGAGASSGMAMAHWEMHGWLILLLGWLFVPFYSRSGVFTMPEFLEKRYNKESRSVLSIISLVSYVLTKVAVTVYAGGVVFKDVFGIESIWGIDFFWISAIGLVVITGIYTTLGGMKAVLWTSVLQTPVLLAGSITVLIAGLIKVGGWDELMHICRAVPVNEYGDTMTQLIRSPKDAQFPWTGVLLGSAIIGFWYWCTDQYIVQRVLSGRDQTQARRGAIFGGALKLTPVFIFLIPGMIAYALNQQGVITLASSDSAFSTLVKELLPIGFKGLVVGGILAALMSSLASLFNSSATLFTIDFYQKYRPKAPEAELVRVGRIATVIVVVLGILWIPVMKGIGKVLYAYLQDVQSILAPGIAAAFLLGILSKKITPAAGLTGLLTGFTIGMFRLIFTVFKGSLNPDGSIYQVFVGTNWLHYEIINFAIVIVTMIVVSYFTPRIDERRIAGLTLGSASAEEKAITRASWNKWDVIASAAIIVVILVFYAYFWN